LRAVTLVLVDIKDRFVLVRARTLDDLCGLVDIALRQLDEIQPHDALNESLRGALAEVRCHALLEPV
jgi:hypothetical protein